MKRILTALIWSALLVTTLCPMAFAGIIGGVGVDYRMELKGDYIPAPVNSFKPTPGEKLTDGWQMILGRFGRFAMAHKCHVDLWLWQSLDSLSCEYNSFEAAVEGIKQVSDETSVGILYIGDLNEAYVHVGDQLIPNYDTDKLMELLRHSEAENEFSQFVSIFNTLNTDAGKATGRYATYIERPGKVEEQAIRTAVKPLHEVFPGHVCVDYRSQRHETFTSILRAFREIDYNKEYDYWEYEMDYYYRDAIYITYYADTGDAFIDIGEDTGIKLSDGEIRQLEAAFAAAADESDCSGFAAGVSALAEAVAAPAESGGGDSAIVIAAAAAVVLVTAVVLVKAKKRA